MWIDEQSYKFFGFDFDPRQVALVKRQPIRKSNLVAHISVIFFKPSNAWATTKKLIFSPNLC